MAFALRTGRLGSGQQPSASCLDYASSSNVSRQLAEYGVLLANAFDCPH
jgi:hypothetical protein